MSTLEPANRLPIHDALPELEQLWQQQPVVIVCGETGCGKTTGIPPWALQQDWMGDKGQLILTQPRRLAAQTIARRLADQLGSKVGDIVGLHTRVHRQFGPDSRLRVMTDGMLLSCLNRRDALHGVQAIMIDEAHERSLNIDLLLGILRQKLSQTNSQLRLLISSASLDAERFADFFHHAPVLRVPGRSFPIRTHYLPSDKLPLPQQVAQAMDWIDRAHDRGDVLVFVSGERDIQDCAALLRQHHLPNTDILPLYARLSPAQQQQVFSPSPRRKVILATNVAETSITVPGITVVIDSGVARISRFSPASRVQRLHIEPIARDSAQQRQGRCGRVAPGTCLRLYDEDDLQQRPEHSDPEILRSNLAGVMLRMANLRLGAMEQFPFITPPPGRLINDARRQLRALQAIDERDRPSRTGKIMARLPLDPALARALISGQRLGCLQPLLIIVSALSVDRLHRIPPEARQHPPFASKKRRLHSDFVFFLRLWRHLHEHAAEHSRSQHRAYAEELGIHWPAYWEWRGLYRQLLGHAQRLHWSVSAQPQEADAAVHQALLTGLYDHLGQKTPEGDYQMAGGRRFRLGRESVLAKKSPRWVLAAGFLDTGHTWAHMAAELQPGWIEQAIPHLCHNSWGEPWWDEKQACARIPCQHHYQSWVLSRSQVLLKKHQPEQARRLLIEAALVEGRCLKPADWLQHNLATLKQARRWEHRLRRFDLLIDAADQADWYDRILPANITDITRLRRWYAECSTNQQQALIWTEHDLLREPIDAQQTHNWPDTLSMAGQHWPLHYRYEVGHPEDGIRLDCRLSDLALLDAKRLAWGVPGQWEQRLLALLRALPKSLRKALIPLPDCVTALDAVLPFAHGSLPHALSAAVERVKNIDIDPACWDIKALPEALQLVIHLQDNNGQTLAHSRDVSALQQQHAAQWQRQQQRAIPHLGVPQKHWQQGRLMQAADSRKADQQISGLRWYAKQRSLQLCLFDQRPAAEHSSLDALSHWCLQQAAIVKAGKNLPDALQALRAERAWQLQPLSRQAVYAACRHLLGQTLPDTPKAFQQQLPQLPTAVKKLLTQQHPFWCSLLTELNALADVWPDNWPTGDAAASDLRQHAKRLIGTNPLMDWPLERWPDWLRYVQALQQRSRQRHNNPQRDRQRWQQIQPWSHRLWQSPQSQQPAWQQARLMLEEWRVSLFAQNLGTRLPVSEARIAQLPWWQQT